MGIEAGYDVAVDPNKLRSDMFLLVRDLVENDAPYEIIKAYTSAFDYVLAHMHENEWIKKEVCKEHGD